MGKIFKNQDAIRFVVHTEQDLSGALEKYIKYIKPNGSAGSWIAAFDDGSGVNGILYYDVQVSTELDKKGEWKFWSYIKFSDGRSAPGEIQKVIIYDEGEDEI